MIHIGLKNYGVDLRLNRHDAGLLMDCALDLLEDRGTVNANTERYLIDEYNTEKTAADSLRATEIVPQPFADDDDKSPKLFFTGEEWSLIAKMTFLLRDYGILPDLSVKAYINIGEPKRGIVVCFDSGEKEIIPLDRNCGKLHILKELVDMADRWCEEP